MSYEADEAWNNAHDPQRRNPVAYCKECGAEIYTEEAVFEFDGYCQPCYYAAQMTPDTDEPCMGECCGTCKWHDWQTWACFNGDSPYRSDFTEPHDGCRFWEERDDE